jgi:hypothetical protein
MQNIECVKVTLNITGTATEDFYTEYDDQVYYYLRRRIIHSNVNHAQRGWPFDGQVYKGDSTSF